MRPTFPTYEPGLLGEAPTWRAAHPTPRSPAPGTEHLTVIITVIITVTAQGVEF